MKPLQLAKIQNTINEIENLLTKDPIDPANSIVLLQRSVNQLTQLLVHIGYIEAKLETLTERENNLVAEIQRLSQIAKY
jgi:chaperonin cofactor prefoldin